MIQNPLKQPQETISVQNQRLVLSRYLTLSSQRNILDFDFYKRFGGRLPLPGVLTDNVFGFGPLTSNYGQTEHRQKEKVYTNELHKISHVEEEGKPSHYILEEIRRLREENAYLSSLIKSLVPQSNSETFYKKATPSPIAIQISQQRPTVLKLRENKNNSKFIIPIFKAEEDNDNSELDQIYQDSFLTKPKLYGLDLLKNSPLTDSSWKFKSSRFRRSLQGSREENLILKRPSVFNHIDGTTRVKTSLNPVSASPLITNSEPSTFYQVPPPSPDGQESFSQLPPETAGTSFYESNEQEDVSLHPSFVIQELQQQVRHNCIDIQWKTTKHLWSGNYEFKFPN